LLQLVRSLLDRAQAAGLNVLRTWAHPVSPQYALQPAPGQYNEAAFRGLDYLLDEARKRGVRLLLALTDNWQPTGGADQFVSWAGGATHEDFFTAERAPALYKEHVRVVLTRVNTVNGQAYRDDPTIFAWDLINEPRCYRCGAALERWVKEMAAFVKSIDPNHLLTGETHRGGSAAPELPPRCRARGAAT
jgi:mannan endo-1,4-beta-mannosidase